MAAVMAVILISGSCVKGKDNIKLKIHEPKSFTSGWKDVSAGREVGGTAVNIPGFSTKTFTNIVPQDVSDNVYICIWNSNFHITASVNGKVISEMGSGISRRFAEENGALWQIIPLDYAYRGQVLTLTVENRNRTRSFNLDKVYLGPYNDIQFELVKGSVFYFLETVFILLVGIVLLVYALLLRRYHLMEHFYSLFFLSLLAIDAGIWFFSNSAVLQYFISSPSIRYLLSYLSFYLLPVFLQFFYIETPGNRSLVLGSLVTAYMAWITVALILYRVNLLPLSISIITVHAFVMFSIFVIIILCLMHFHRTHDRYIFWTLAAFLILTTGALISLYGFYTRTGADNAHAFRISFVLFLLLLIVTNVKESMKEFNDMRTVLHYKQLAYMDPVTGGNTRLYFEEKIRKLPTTGYYFLHMNILQFKIINQVLGREKCDELLGAIYKAFEKSLRENEEICNLGNAALGLYLAAENEEHIHERCRILKTLVQQCVLEKKISMIVNTQFCITPALEQADAPNLNELQDHALMARLNPLAIYWQDANCYVYNRACGAQLIKDKNLEDRLDLAIRNHEIVTWLQPKIALADGSVCSAEALARWIDPEKGIISPGEFIPVFERNGMISKIDLCIFEEVCNMINQWISEGKTPPVISVNISKAAIRQDDFFNKYVRIAEKTGVPAEYLEFELTESTAYENYDLIRKILEEIHQIGAGCSMDDFGKSYSNISALATLQFNAVKMDKSFFDDGFPMDSRRYQLVSGTMQLLKSLNLEVVAEGIEKKEQVDSLKTLGCDSIQGFYFAKPMPQKQFELFVEKKKLRKI
jgi:EAL domain-containing protein (putative c-di-GMP-specific phosphodiesterase class I)/GGDEF domain-containing protein